MRGYRQLRCVLDTPANSVYGPVEVLQSAHMDWLHRYSFGDMLHINGLQIS
jgi:hypothetical protein